MFKTKMTYKRYEEIKEMGNETISHWRQVVKGQLHYRTTVDCPACKKYLYQRNNCNGCYIAEQTDNVLCLNTPIQAYLDLWAQYYSHKNWDIAIELKAAAQDCLDFLLRLRKTAMHERLVEFLLEGNIRPEHKHGSCNEFITPLSEV